MHFIPFVLHFIPICSWISFLLVLSIYYFNNSIVYVNLMHIIGERKKVIMEIIYLFLLLLLLLLLKINAKQSSSLSSSSSSSSSIAIDIVSGGLAGGISNAILFPIDTIKTMRQSDNQLNSFQKAIDKISRKGIKMNFLDRSKFILRDLYSGFWPAVLGSIPSSSLYFGSYETSKKLIYKHLNIDNTASSSRRALVHMSAAAIGNVVSSFIFVPKEAIKSQMQAIKTGSIIYGGSSSPSSLRTVDVINSILKSKGLKGFYPSYRATLLRNIPSAIARFTIYEELRLIIKSSSLLSATSWSTSLGYLLAGASASMLSSALTTPFDVIKTRLSTGVISPGTPVLLALKGIAKKEGIIGLYAGVQERILWSSLFGGLGFSAFEKCKEMLQTKHSEIVRT